MRLSVIFCRQRVFRVSDMRIGIIVAGLVLCFLTGCCRQGDSGEQGGRISSSLSELRHRYVVALTNLAYFNQVRPMDVDALEVQVAELRKELVAAGAYCTYRSVPFDKEDVANAHMITCIERIGKCDGMYVALAEVRLLGSEADGFVVEAFVRRSLFGSLIEDARVLKGDGSA